MNYLFKGRICGYICDECSEPLARVKVRLYRSRPDQDITTLAVANPKDTFAILTEEEVRAKQGSLLIEVETNDVGEFTAELGDQQGYKGGAFEVDVYCGNVPHHIPGPKPPKPLQFSITTLQPLWRRTETGLMAIWEYCLSHRYWCLVRARFGAWTICGQLTLCKTGAPLGNMRVRAFDVDWLQDDSLGAAITDANGHFRIDYVSAAFKKDILGLNIELFGGPDLYFKVETLGGAPLLAEPPSRGRAPDRENVGHCFCVKLCVDKAPEDPNESIPAFFALGGYDFAAAVPDIHSVVPGSGLTVADNRAFYSTVRLNGILSKKLNSTAMEYRFEFRTTQPNGTPIGPWTPVDPGQMAATRIGHLEWVAPAFPGDPNPTKHKDCVVKGSAPGQLVPAIVGGWIQVPQQSNALNAPPAGDLINPTNLGFFSPNGNMINLITPSLAAFGTKNMTGVKAGTSSTSNGETLAAARHFALRMRVREQGNPATEITAGECSHVAINNTGYDNIVHHPSWMVINDPPGTLGVCLVDIAQSVVIGCQPITDALDVLITTTHPQLGAVSLGMAGPGGPYSFVLPAAVPGERFGSTSQFSADAAPATLIAVKDLKPCGYLLTLTAPLLLTTGDSIPTPLQDQIVFCKK